MDTLTHTAVGLFLSRAGLNRWTPQATPILLLAANAPDIDIVSALGGWSGYLHYHRHITHSLAALPLMAALPVLLVRGVGRRRVHWLGAFCAAAVAVMSHLLLDLTNVYGVRLWEPFSSRWLRLDLTNIVDLCIWAAFLLALAGPFLAGLVGGEMQPRRARDARHGRGFAVFALVFVLFYNGARAAAHLRAVNALDARLYRGETPLRVAAFPDAFNPLRWRGLAETADFIAVSDLDLNGEFDPSRSDFLYKPENEPALAAARRAPAIQAFLEFSQFPFWRVTPAADIDNGRLVEVFDLRFGDPQSPGFMARATVDSANRVARSALGMGARLSGFSSRNR
jgi:inner membrane protein